MAFRPRQRTRSILSLTLSLIASTASAQTPPQRVVVGSSAVLVTTTATTARVATPTGTVLWEGPTTWQGEDLGMRTRDALSVDHGAVVRERYEEGGGTINGSDGGVIPPGRECGALAEGAV